MLNDDCIKALDKIDFKTEAILNSGFYFYIANYDKNLIGFEFNEEYFKEVEKICKVF